MALRDTKPQGKLKIGVVMDPISDIKVEKDTTLASFLQPRKRPSAFLYGTQRPCTS